MIAFFKIILLPLHFLWRSSLSSIKTVAKSYHQLYRCEVPSLTHLDGQKPAGKREVRKIRIIQKMHHLSLNILAWKLELNTSNVSDEDEILCTERTYDVNMTSNAAIQYSAISETRPDEPLNRSEQIKPKGILKNTHFTRSCSLTNGCPSAVDDRQNLEKPATVDLVATPTNSSSSLSSSGNGGRPSLMAKHVKFSERILQKKYEPSQPVSRLSKSRHRPQCRSKTNQTKRSSDSPLDHLALSSCNNTESNLTSYNRTIQRTTSETVILFDSTDDDDSDDE